MLVWVWADGWEGGRMGVGWVNRGVGAGRVRCGVVVCGVEVGGGGLWSGCGLGGSGCGGEWVVGFGWLGLGRWVCGWVERGGVLVWVWYVVWCEWVLGGGVGRGE